MARPALRINLLKNDRKELEQLLHDGIQQVRVILRALSLLMLADGDSAPQVARAVRLTPQTMRNLTRRYEQHGLERALYDKARPGAARVLDQKQQQRIIAMVCSDPPKGHARWTVRLVVEEAVKRRLVPRVGRETIRILLLHHDLRPWREKNVVRAKTR
jgi:transposase